MTGRKDIEPDAKGWRRLSYTCRCGWVDWGHALPGSALSLKRQVDTEQTDVQQLARMNVQLNGAPAYVLNYGQEMGVGAVRFSTAWQWVVRKGLSTGERRSVALGIFLSASFHFERFQGSFPFSIVSGQSSFSAEDLISNVIGFYCAFESISQTRMRQVCAEVSVDECYRLWDKHLPNGLGALKNHGLKPLLFQCSQCDGSQSDTSFPWLLSSVQAAPPGTLWVRLKNRFIDGRLVNAGKAISVTGQGDVTVGP